METNKSIIDTTMPDLSAQNEQSAATSANPATTDDGPNLSIDIEPVEGGKPININLPVFLTRHMHDPAKYVLLQQALRNVFRQFYHSDDYAKPDTKIERDLAYRALELSFEKVLEWGAKQVISPLPNKEVEVPGDIEENPYQPQAVEALMYNPANYADLEHLQKWVANLQDMVINLNHTAGALKRIADNQERIITNQDLLITDANEKIDQWERFSAKQELLIEQLRRQIPAEQAPEAKSYLALKLTAHTTYKGASEVQILIYALEEYMESRKDQSVTEALDSSWESAFSADTDAQTAQDILDSLRESAVELADHNYKAAKCKGDSDAFRKSEAQEKQEHSAYLSWFVTSHSVGAGEEQEETEPVEPMLDPDFYLDLTDTEKDVLNYLQAKGVPEHQLKQWAVNFQNMAGSEDHPEITKQWVQKLTPEAQ